jgi:hypothetical protein
MNTTSLDDAFASGALLGPVSATPSFVDFARALSAKLSCGPTATSPHQAAVENFIGEADHIVFVLVDGMGWMLLEQLPPDKFLRAQRKMELRAVFPSTTGCALPSLASAHWPARHGAPGWWAYLEERDLSIVTLPFQERSSKKSLRDFGISTSEIWALPPWLQKYRGDAKCVMPAGIVNSAFSQCFRGLTYEVGYQTIAEAMDIVLSRNKQLSGRSYTYLYLPHFDSDSHSHGVGSQKTHQTLLVINDELERLAAGLNGRARLLISADHGLLDVPESGHLMLLEGDPLLALIKAPPSGEPRAPIFHIHAGQETKFKEMFEQRFGSAFVLLSAKEVAARGLLGPEPLSPIAKRSFGDFIGIAMQPASIEYQLAAEPSKPEHVGQHGGLAPEEMRIPLIVV